MVDNGDPAGQKATPEEMLSDEARGIIGSKESDEINDAELFKKKELWETMEGYIRRSTEGWGGVEPGIAATVIALNLFGIRTDQSCEGHPIEWPTLKGWPFVTFDKKDSINARLLVDEFYKKNEHKHHKYVRLTVEQSGYWGADTDYILQSQGVERLQLPRLTVALVLFPEKMWKKRQEKINAMCADEMRRFTAFLQDKFYSDEYKPERYDYGKTLRGRFRLMDMDELRGSKDLGIWDQEESVPMSLPLSASVAKVPEYIKKSIPDEQIGQVGPFTTCASPESHIGPYKNSVDFIVEDGSPVMAMHPGNIVEIKDDSEKWGDDPSMRNELNYVTIYHPTFDGDFYSQYSHIKKGSVPFKIGDSVRPGQQIGQVGKNGWTDRDHLHIAVYKKDDRSQNPFGFKSLKISWDKKSELR